MQNCFRRSLATVRLLGGSAERREHMTYGRKTGGRQKGTPNKLTRDVKDLVREALESQPGGGVAYLRRQAVEQPVAFMNLVSKAIPREIQGTMVTATLEQLVVLSMERGEKRLKAP